MSISGRPSYILKAAWSLISPQSYHRSVGILMKVYHECVILLTSDEPIFEILKNLVLPLINVRDDMRINCANFNSKDRISLN